MALERITIKEKRTKNEIARDKIFYILAHVMVKDYFNIHKKYEDTPFVTGKEFMPLHGALIIFEPKDKDIKNYCRKIEYFKPIDLDEKDIVNKLALNLEADGARVIKNNKLVFKASVYAYHKAEKKEGIEITDLIKKYITSSASSVGERETAALAFSIATGKNTYTISQTTQPTQRENVAKEKKYSKIGTGKVTEFGPKGLTRIIKLENGNESVPTEHLLDKDVYIKQYSYEFKDGIHISGKNYIPLEDLILLPTERIF